MTWLFLTIACFMCATEKSGANPEVSMDVGEIVRYHGYPYEEHEVVTDDGYYLTLQRIPHGRDNPERFSISHGAEAQASSMFCLPPKAVVLLQHGLVLEGSNWVTNLPNTSLGFILADASYDVWIGNSRGNSWSRKHKEFEFYHQQYSSYSFHEMAIYDLPATINYILQKTGQEQLYYVGYSQGTTTGFIAFSSIPELDRKIKMFFALAPITVNSNMKSPLVRVFDLPEVLIKLILGHTVVFDKDDILKQVVSRMCTHPMLKSLCSLVFYLSGGFTNSLNVSRMDVYLARYPDSTSLKNMLHWRQLYQTGEFKCYDYGSDNVLHYNQSTPPFYELENMKTPLAAWYGGKDWISAPEDVDITLPRISNVVYKKYIPEFVHFDFLWGKQVYEQVYKEMLDLMEKSA
ncbi:lysosomal acid lipase/cholesteryl ester hydrolase-like [Corvus cornix cornix]|uniref:lysosomal acid lipase/cholesteryl ester hydrolase-like n=1 Tax=Corvus cornix cornix TaxID=932674 RepID=UPI0019508C23|nr:lysosomal acid lipase/cholesteryl ester hydrolase-like [Corvus cornix cornix]